MDVHHPEHREQTRELVQIVHDAKRASAFLKALAHHGRLMILCLLTEHEMSVKELEESLGLRQAAVSQQLARLRADGLVATRRAGKAIYYRLASDEALMIIRAVHDVFCGQARAR